MQVKNSNWNYKQLKGINTNVCLVVVNVATIWVFNVVCKMCECQT